MSHDKSTCPYLHHWESGDCEELHRMAPKPTPLPTERTTQDTAPFFVNEEECDDPYRRGTSVSSTKEDLGQ